MLCEDGPLNHRMGVNAEGHGNEQEEVMAPLSVKRPQCISTVLEARPRLQLFRGCSDPHNWGHSL